MNHTPSPGEYPLPGPYSGPLQLPEERPDALPPVPVGAYSLGEEVTVLRDDPATHPVSADGGPPGLALQSLAPGDRRLLVVAVVALVLLVLAVLGSRLVLEFVELYAFSPWLGGSYLAVVALLVGCLGYGAWRSWRRYQRVRDVTQLRELVQAYRQPPHAPDADERLRREWQEYLADLEQHAEPSLRECINRVQRKFDDYTGDADRDLEILEEFLLIHLDRRADQIIEQRAVQTAVSTALASRLFDSLIVTWQCLGLVNQLSRLYAGRPGIWGTFRLFRRGMAMIVFVELADLARSLLTETLAQKSLQALGSRVAEGTANGVVMLRFGEAVKQQCRPAPLPQPAPNPVTRLYQALIAQGMKLPRLKTASD